MVNYQSYVYLKVFRGGIEVLLKIHNNHASHVVICGEALHTAGHRLGEKCESMS